MIRRCFRIFPINCEKMHRITLFLNANITRVPKKIPPFACLSVYFRRICVSPEKSTEKNTCRSGDASQTARV